MRNGNRRSSWTRVPSPRDEFVFREVRNDFVETAPVVLLGIKYGPADLAVGESLPDHGFI